MVCGMELIYNFSSYQEAKEYNKQIKKFIYKGQKKLKENGVNLELQKLKKPSSILNLYSNNTRYNLYAKKIQLELKKLEKGIKNANVKTVFSRTNKESMLGRKSYPVTAVFKNHKKVFDRSVDCAKSLGISIGVLKNILVGRTENLCECSFIYEGNVIKRVKELKEYNKSDFVGFISVQDAFKKSGVSFKKFQYLVKMGGNIGEYTFLIPGRKRNRRSIYLDKVYNTTKRGKKVIYKSIHDAHLQTGLKLETIRRNISKHVFPIKNGYNFKYLEKLRG
jgi:hypothetical protein